MEETLRAAADMLDECAGELRGVYTLADAVTWPDLDDEHRAAHQRHDRMIELADALRRIAAGPDAIDSSTGSDRP